MLIACVFLMNAMSETLAYSHEKILSIELKLVKLEKEVATMRIEIMRLKEHALKNALDDESPAVFSRAAARSLELFGSDSATLAIMSNNASLTMSEDENTYYALIIVNRGVNEDAKLQRTAPATFTIYNNLIVTIFPF